uniref:Uncharacterized protein n=1 Tax=Romanomermis culicivorax TaxID=13658 RepID=A0A915J064_ROMCU
MLSDSVGNSFSLKFCSPSCVDSFWLIVIFIDVLPPSDDDDVETRICRFWVLTPVPASVLPTTAPVVRSSAPPRPILNLFQRNE